MPNLTTVELKTFIPAKNYQTSINFYRELGFEHKSEHSGVSYFLLGKCSFLLQDFYHQELAENLMLHLLVDDVNRWHQHALNQNLVEKYEVQISEVKRQPWGMHDFTLTDPSGVLWRIAENDRQLFRQTQC